MTVGSHSSRIMLSYILWELNACHPLVRMKEVAKHWTVGRSFSQWQIWSSFGFHVLSVSLKGRAVIGCHRFLISPCGRRGGGVVLLQSGEREREREKERERERDNNSFFTASNDESINDNQSHTSSMLIFLSLPLWFLFPTLYRLRIYHVLNPCWFQ